MTVDTSPIRYVTNQAGETTDVLIPIETDLYHQAQAQAVQHQVSLEQWFTQVIRQHLWELDRRKIAQESQFYHEQYEQLKQQFLGQYIAMHQGQVVDHDVDFVMLRQRVKQTFGRVPIMMTKVEATPHSALARRGFVMEH